MVRRQENDLSFNIGITVQRLLVSQKFIAQVVVSKKYSRQSFSQQFMVNPSSDLFNANHVGCPLGHLHQYLIERKNSAMGKHLIKAHGSLCYLTENQFRILCKCCTKFECLVNEMLLINERNPRLKARNIFPKLLL